jgi:hypothetical protein
MSFFHFQHNPATSKIPNKPEKTAYTVLYSMKTYIPRVWTAFDEHLVYEGKGLCAIPLFQLLSKPVFQRWVHLDALILWISLLAFFLRLSPSLAR